MEVDEDGIANVVANGETIALKPNTTDLCRLCANTDSQLIPIFKGEGLEHNIHDKIKQHLPIVSVSESDKLPLQICYQCASTLISWHNLYEASLVADRRLRDLLDFKYEDKTFDICDGIRDHNDESKSTIDESSSQSSITHLQTDKLIINVDTDAVKSFNIDGPAIEKFDKKRSVESKTHSEQRQLVKNVPITSTCKCGEGKDNDTKKCSLCVARDNLLRCNLCPVVFVAKTNLERHLRISHSSLYSRENVSTSAIPKLKRVKKSTPSATPKTCRPKLPSFKKKSAAVIVHIKGHKPILQNLNKKPAAKDVQNSTVTGSVATRGNVHQCKVCQKICLSSRGLTRHSVVHKSFFCDYCSEEFPTEGERNNHVTDFHRIDVPSIKEEASVNKNKADVKKMELDVICDEILSGEKKEDCKPISDEAPKSKPVNCLECNESFATRQLLTNHQKIHIVKAEFTCEQCGKQFSRDKLLRRHMRSIHQVKGKGRSPKKDDPFEKWYVQANGQKHLKCDQCKYNSPWYNKGRFLEHYRIHTGERPFTCDICGKQFRTKTLMQKHVMYVHEGIKEHACDICGRKFSDKRYMVDHRRIHTGERPYICDLCGKTFKQSASLFIHKELHKGLRKHACDMCPKRFTTRSSLNIHIRRHVGERNFICATCGKAFVDGKHLRDHMTVHSDERPFPCELCGARFKLLKHLKQHGRTHKRDYTV